MAKKSVKAEDLAELLKDEKVMEVLVARLDTMLEKKVESIIERVLLKINPVIEQMVKDMLSARCDKMQLKQTHLEEQNEELGRRLDLAEMETRQNNLVVHGLPELEGMNKSKHMAESEATQAIITLCNTTLGLNISDRDISTAYRIPAKGKEKHRPLMVKFTAQRTRGQVFGARTLLRKTAIYINEHLISRNAQLYAKTRNMVKSGSASSTWTTGGWVFLRVTDTPGEKPLKIVKLSDLEKLSTTNASVASKE